MFTYFNGNYMVSKTLVKEKEKSDNFFIYFL